MYWFPISFVHNLIYKIFVILVMIVFLLNKLNKNINSKLYLNSIECGFSKIFNKTNFQLKFWIILMMFVIFDLEMIILLPLLLMNLNLLNKLLILIIFMFINVTLLMEIKNNKIKWL